MEIKIGVVYTPKELLIETDDDADKVASVIESALGGKANMLWLTDTKGRRVGVPTDKIAYVEVGTDAGERTVGFSTR
jgi:hypothetical protein